MGNISIEVPSENFPPPPPKPTIKSLQKELAEALEDVNQLRRWRTTEEALIQQLRSQVQSEKEMRIAVTQARTELEFRVQDYGALQRDLARAVAALETTGSKMPTFETGAATMDYIKRDHFRG